MKKKYCALFLFFITPIIAEFTLGNMAFTDVTSLATYPVLALLYGGGAVLIREMTRKAGRGYITMLFLAIAYGLFEESIVLQTLFNPTWLDLNLHAYGNIPFLGMGGPWTMFVITIHSIWSTMVPIIITESLFPQYKRQPWLGKSGHILYLCLLLLGAAMWGFMTYYEERFMASATQLITAGIIILTLVFLAFRVSLNESKYEDKKEVISPKSALITAFISGSLFMVLFHLGQNEKLFSPTVYVVSSISVMIGTGYILIKNGRRDKWTHFHSFSVGSGLSLAYCWCGFFIQYNLYGLNPLGIAIQLLLIAFVISILVKARTRLKSE